MAEKLPGVTGTREVGKRRGWMRKYGCKAFLMRKYAGITMMPGYRGEKRCWWGKGSFFRQKHLGGVNGVPKVVPSLGKSRSFP